MTYDNTTTCWYCGLHFPDGDMMPLPEEGEACPDCTEKYCTIIATDESRSTGSGNIEKWAPNTHRRNQ